MEGKAHSREVSKGSIVMTATRDNSIDWDDTDTELIECSKCEAALNGKSLWVVGEADDVKILCEACYSKLMQRD